MIGHAAALARPARRRADTPLPPRSRSRYVAPACTDIRPATALIGVSNGRSPGVGSSVSYATPLTPRVEQLLAELLRRREVEVREQQQIFAHQRELGRDRLFDLHDHVRLAPHLVGGRRRSSRPP